MYQKIFDGITKDHLKYKLGSQENANSYLYNLNRLMPVSQGLDDVKFEAECTKENKNQENLLLFMQAVLNDDYSSPHYKSSYGIEEP